MQKSFPVLKCTVGLWQKNTSRLAGIVSIYCCLATFSTEDTRVHFLLSMTVLFSLTGLTGLEKCILLLATMSFITGRKIHSSPL